MMLRRQLPANSPLPFPAILAALGRSDPRPTLADDLRRTHGATEVILTASGTAALTLALICSARRRPGSPVLLPAYACYDLVSAALGAGVKVAFYDIEPSTLGPARGAIEQAAPNGAAALVAVHLFGVPVAMDAMRASADKVGALLVEDAAQGTGAAWRGRPLGGTGDFGVLSFGRGKGETGGSGGALLVREPSALDDDVRKLVRPARETRLVPALMLAGQWTLGRPGLYVIPSSIPALRLGETIYRPPEPLHAMAPGAARVLIHTRRRVEAETHTRRVHAARWLAALQGTQAVTVDAPPGSEPGWLRFPLLLSPSRALLASGAALGVRRGYPQALHALEDAAPLFDHAPSTPGADRLARSLLTLPTHGLLRERDRRAIERWLERAVRDSDHA